MSIQTSTGVKIYISTQLPATFDLAGYGALTWTEIKEVTNIVPPSPSYQVVTHEPLKTGIKQKNKGFVDYGDPTIDYALDTSDTGQQMLQSAASGATKNLEHSFKLTYPNGDIRYFSGRVFSSLEGGFSANSMVSGTSNVGVSRAVVKIPAISFAANYVTNTYSILGEAKTFSEAHNFTRSTTATFVGSNGLIQSAAIDAPRFTYDPVTLAPKGLLIEGSRTNLLTYSEQFDDASWLQNNTTATSNATTAPDGTVTADKLVEDAILGNHYLYKTNTVSGSHCFSCYVKPAERFRVRLNAGSATADFNLTTLEATVVSGALTPVIEDVGNGWRRISAVSNRTGVANQMQIALIDGSGELNYTGDGTSGVYVWGAQYEAGSFASSYIPTTTAQVTRTADVCTAKEFTSWYNQGEGSVFVDAYSIDDLPFSYNTIINFSDGTLDNRVSCAIYNGLTSDRLEVVTGGVSQANVILTGRNVSGDKSSFRYNQNSASVFRGESSLDESLASLPLATQARVGSRPNGSYLSGTIAELNYYPTALSDEALQDLTR